MSLKMNLNKKIKTIMIFLTVLIAVTGIMPATGYAADGQDNTSAAPVVKNIAPESIVAKDAKGYDTINVSWSAVPGASGYTLYISTSPSTGFKKVATTAATTYTVKNVTTGSTRYFKVETEMKSTAGIGSTTTSTGTNNAPADEATNEETSNAPADEATNEETSNAPADETTNEEENNASTDEVIKDETNGGTTGEIINNESDVVSAKPILDSTNGSMYLNTGTKATVKWTKVAGASGYLVYKRAGSKWKGVRNIRSGSTVKVSKTKVTKKSTNTFKIIPYRTVSGKKVKGYAETTSLYVPKVLKKSTKTYSKTNQAKIIKKARTKLGSRYVLGAEGPNRFDCSGFTYWVMKHAGVSGVKIKRTSAQGIYNRYKKYSIGRSLSKAQPGDILLFGYGRSTHRIFHVGIYYGSGKYIHATTGGRGVTITNVPTGQMVAILRLSGLK